MSSASDYLELKILDHTLGTASYSAPAAVYVALFTANTGLEANNPTAECTGASYVRKAATFSSAASGAATTSADVTFDEATGSWGTITHVALVDHATNTNWGTDVNVLYAGALSASKVIEDNDTFVIEAGDLTVSLD